MMIVESVARTRRIGVAAFLILTVVLTLVYTRRSDVMETNFAMLCQLRLFNASLEEQSLCTVKLANAATQQSALDAYLRREIAWRSVLEEHEWIASRAATLTPQQLRSLDDLTIAQIAYALYKVGHQSRFDSLAKEYPVVGYYLLFRAPGTLATLGAVAMRETALEILTASPQSLTPHTRLLIGEHYLELAQFYDSVDDDVNEESAIRRAREFASQDATILLHYARVLQRDTASSIEAQRVYQSVLDLKDASEFERFTAYLGLSQLAVRGGDPTQAESILLIAHEELYPYPLTAVAIGRLHQELKTKSMAAHWYKKALEIDPACPDAHYYLAMMYENEGMSLAIRRQHLETALENGQRLYFVSRARVEDELKLLSSAE